MAYPAQLQAAIEREVGAVDRTRLASAAARITATYKEGRFHGALDSAESRAAYLITRLPATFAANLQVFREVAQFADLIPSSLLDLGAGPGTAMWAAREVWPSLPLFRLVENNANFLQLGKRLAGESADTEWFQSDIAQMPEFPASDLVVLSYVVGELKNPVNVVERAWAAARKALVVIEPGTPRNFAVIADLRRQLIELGGHMIAPCPHSQDCPMSAANDWCHFSVRLARSSEHRRLKGGALGYEDEKFSYLAFSKSPVQTNFARIIRHPLVHSGHIQLKLCTANGLQSRTVTRSEKQPFRAARNAKWGDRWDENAQLE